VLGGRDAGQAAGLPAAEGARTAREAIDRLYGMYSGTAGYEFEHIVESEHTLWRVETANSSKRAVPRTLKNSRPQMTATRRRTRGSSPGPARATPVSAGLTLVETRAKPGNLSGWFG
jgi:hypothetical protein